VPPALCRRSDAASRSAPRLTARRDVLTSIAAIPGRRRSEEHVAELAAPRTRAEGASQKPWDALHPDGKRLAIFARRQKTQTSSGTVVLTFNFSDELRRLVPTHRSNRPVAHRESSDVT
jgi:hypothetical protein